jgi:outer membrane protein TolC
VLDTTDHANVWGSTVGFLVSWEPFDFGLRKANVATAEAGRLRAQAALERTRFEVASLAADAYLTVVAAEQTLRAAQAQVERSRKIDTVVGALVKSELRPGADASRTRAEMALAESQVISAEQAIRNAKITLKQLTGRDITVSSAGLLSPPAEFSTTANLETNPFAREQKTAIDESEARLQALERAYFPRFNLQAATYARGTGARIDGSTGGALSGFGPNVHNWAVGMTVTFPAFELPSIRIRREIEKHKQEAETARYQQVITDLTARRERALAAVDTARRLAGQLPVQLEAARAAEQQATARYQAGLGTLVEVAEAQRLLTQTEIDDSLARLNVWRALLALAAAEGDLKPFLERIP